MTDLMRKYWKLNARWDDPDLEWFTEPNGERWAMLDIGDESIENRPVVVVIEYQPNEVKKPHRHESDYVSITVRGEITVSGHLNTVGSMRFAGEGTVYGPQIAGPEGCTVIDFFVKRKGMIAIPTEKDGIFPDVQAEKARIRDERLKNMKRRRS